jgi:leucyl-tRNA synthetase
MRDRLRKWCDNGLARITEDTEQLQMHKAVRNITRLFERIQDFEKRVVKRRGQLDRADAEAQIAALVLLARALAPFAPHTAEELLLGSGRDGTAELPVRWPEAASIPVAAEPSTTGG